MAGVSREQFQVICRLLDEHPEGLTLPDIRAVLDPKPDARTLRELLEQLDGQTVRIDATQHTVRYYAAAPFETRNAGGELETRNSKLENADTPAAEQRGTRNAKVENTPAPAAPADVKFIPPAATIPQSEIRTPQSPTPPPASKIENRDSKIENPSTPQSAVRNPQFTDNLVFIAVSDFVRAGIVPQTARLLAENGARQNGLTGAEVGPFVERVLGILANLSEAEAGATYGISADEYRTWAEHCGYAAGAHPPADCSGFERARVDAPAGSRSTVHGSPSAPSQAAPRGYERERVDAPASSRFTVHGSRSAPRRADPRGHGRERVVPSAIATDVAPPAAPSPAPLRAPSAPPPADLAASTPDARLRALVAQLKDVRPSWFWSKRWSVSNHIVTGRRLLIATLWAAPWMYLQQHSVAFAVNAGWAVVVLVPLPWIVFRWLDHPTQGPLTGKTAVGLGIGTTYPFLLASPLSALGDWMINRLPRALVALATLSFTTPGGELETRNAKPDTTANATVPSTSPARSPGTTPGSVSKPPPSPVTEKPSPIVFTPPPPPVRAPIDRTPVPSTKETEADDPAMDVPVQGSSPSPSLPRAGTTGSASTTPSNPGAPEIENRDSNTEAAKPPISAIESPPPFPSAPGAYALTSAGWSPLLRNDVRVIALTPHAPYPEDKQPAGSSELIVAELVFSGSEPLPSIPPTGATLIYVGPLPASVALGARPVLRRPGEGGPPSAASAPPLELGVLNVGTGTARMAPLTNSTGGPSLGPRRVAATLEQASGPVTVLHPTARLAPGRYALHCADQYFEVAVSNGS